MQVRSERTRRKLVQAGAEMFRRNGYANATLGEIAAFAGVTKGALYFHFASKEELAEAVHLRGCALLHESVGALRASGLRPLQTLIDTTHWLAWSLREEPAVPAGFRITKERAGLQEVTTDFHRVWFAVVCGLLRQAQEAGELRSGNSWESVESLVAATAFGIEAMAGTGMPYAELQRRVTGMWLMLLPSLVPEGAEAGYRVGTQGAGLPSRGADGPLDDLGKPLPVGVTGSTR
ncbi:ScbR family autoregulator-binding transcription factor [Streptomyces sp. NPDC005808]|uniref:ScbR family autoregulator-binding transcription factor n=1 Tax=Streptomyces sp. NPDC005808 TaxID=3364734 RepID=UPI0036B6206E